MFSRKNWFFFRLTNRAVCLTAALFMSGKNALSIKILWLLAVPVQGATLLRLSGE